MANKRILVIDDDAMWRRILSIAMKKSGYDCETAANGEEAVAKLEEQTFDGIVVDMMMPFMDGLSFLHWLRGEKGLSTPVLVQTSLPREKIEGEVMSAGANGLVNKPATARVLLDRLQEILEA